MGALRQSVPQNGHVHLHSVEPCLLDMLCSGPDFLQICLQDSQSLFPNVFWSGCSLLLLILGCAAKGTVNRSCGEAVAQKPAMDGHKSSNLKRFAERLPWFVSNFKGAEDTMDSQKPFPMTASLNEGFSVFFWRVLNIWTTFHEPRYSSLGSRELTAVGDVTISP